MLRNVIIAINHFKSTLNGVLLTKKTQIMNMSYCRFRNTSLDLQDCIDAINNGEINDLSRDEQQAFVNLIMQCKEVAENFEDYDDYELEDFIKEQQEEV